MDCSGIIFLNDLLVIEEFSGSCGVGRAVPCKKVLALPPTHMGIAITVVENTPQLKARIGHRQLHIMRQGEVLSLRKALMLVSVEHGPYGVIATEWILAQFTPLGNGLLNDRSGVSADADDHCRLYAVDAHKGLQVLWFRALAFRYNNGARRRRLSR